MKHKTYKGKYLKKIGSIFKYLFWFGVGFVGLMTIINSVYGAYQVSKVTGVNWLDVLTAADSAAHFAAGVVIITCSLFSSLYDHLTLENDE
ncbi:MAG: hypothetical protein WC945_08230, partial [Bacteroidales bacterium]